MAELRKIQTQVLRRTWMDKSVSLNFFFKSQAFSIPNMNNIGSFANIKNKNKKFTCPWKSGLVMASIIIIKDVKHLAIKHHQLVS